MLCRFGATCCWPTPRRRCARRAACCGPAGGSRSPSGTTSPTTRGCACSARSSASAGWRPSSRPATPGPFALSDPEAVRELLDTAGFDDVEIESVDLAFEPASLDAWWDHIVKTSTTAANAVAGLTPAEHYALRDAVDAGYAPYVREDGSLQVPGRALVAAASA